MIRGYTQFRNLDNTMAAAAAVWNCNCNRLDWRSVQPLNAFATYKRLKGVESLVHKGQSTQRLTTSTLSMLGHLVCCLVRHRHAAFDYWACYRHLRRILAKAAVSQTSLGNRITFARGAIKPPKVPACLATNLRLGHKCVSGPSMDCPFSQDYDMLMANL